LGENKMPIGNGPDYYNGINREEDIRVKDGERVQEWWEDLDESDKLDVIESLYPDQVGLIDSDELWMRTDWGDKMDIWREASGFARDYE